MEIYRKNFPHVMRDNDLTYLAHLEGVIDSIDEFASIQFTNGGNKIYCRIAPSIPKYTQALLREILKFNNQFGIKLDLSKSIKTSSTITFNIEL
jgi:hypothetical protein